MTQHHGFLGRPDPALDALALPGGQSRLGGFVRRLPAALGSLTARFLLIVVAPTVAAALYYGLIASDRYVAHASYLVRSVNSHRAGGLSLSLIHI